MKNIIVGIIGYGELGQQIENLIKTSIVNIDFVFFDDIAYKSNKLNAYPFNFFIDEKFKNHQFIIGLGYKHLKLKSEILMQIEQLNRKLFTFVHPTVYADDTAIINEGCVIYPNVTIDKDVVIGKSTLVNLSVTISHNSKIGECCYISPSVCLSGHVSVGDKVFIGSGSCISNGIEVKSSAVIGIGSVIIKNIEEGVNVIGNPQKITNKINLT